MQFILKRLTQLRVPFSLSDLLLIGGTAICTYGVWGYDPRIAQMALGLWLVWLSLPPRGGGAK